MNKDIAIGNKIIYQKMHRKERMRHLQKLQEIKSKPSALLPPEPSFKPHSHPNDCTPPPTQLKRTFKSNATTSRSSTSTLSITQNRFYTQRQTQNIVP